MNRLLFLFLILQGYDRAQSQEIIGKEFLHSPSDHEISVKMAFHDSSLVFIRYGLQSNNLNLFSDTIQFLPETYTSITLQSLNPNTSYFYSVFYQIANGAGFIQRPVYQFHTAKSPEQLCTFLVQADPHLDEQTDTAVYARCLQNQLEDNADFMVDLGDFLMTDKLKNGSGIIPFDTIPYRCKLLRSYYEKISHSVTIFNVLGNHEGEAGWNLNGSNQNIAVQNTLERKKYFGTPFPNGFYSGDTVNFPFVGKRADYYSFTWGNALFIMLDPYWNTPTKPDSTHGWYWSLGEEQYNWLRHTLENSPAKFKFVFAHQLVGGAKEGRGGIEFSDYYEWGGKNLDGSEGFSVQRPGWYKPIKELLKENRVTIFFHGHDHLFAKQEKECLIYQETPQPSHPNFNNAGQADEYGYLNGEILPNSGHLRVTVDTNSVKVEYVRAYKAADENGNRHNKDISAFYEIQFGDCYDSLFSSAMVWNSDYKTDIVYPNPFSEQTSIQFSLKEPAKVSLSIWDNQGNLVKELLKDTQVSSGNKTVVWDGTNSKGQNIAFGIYHYRLLIGSAPATSKKLLYYPIK